MKLVTLNKKIRSDFIYDRILKKNLEAILKDYTERLQDAEKNRLIASKNGISINISDSADSRVVSIGAKGNSVQTTRLLPDGYTQVDYIESTGAQYINTGYTPVEGDDFEFKNIKLNGNGALFAAGTGDYALTFVYQNPTFYYKFFESGTSHSFTVAVPFKNISIRSGKLYFDDTLKVSATYGGEVNTPLYIFNRANLAGNIKAQIGEVIITNNNTKKHHYVPCIRKSDNVIGLYDIVSNTFLTNAGTGTFSYGSLPTPDYQVQIVSAGDDINVFDVNVIQERTTNGITMTFKDQTINLKGTATGNANFYMKSGSSIVLKAGTYFISRSSMQGIATLKLTSGSNTIVATGSTDISFTLESTTTIDGLTLQVSSSVGTIDKDIVIKLQEGSIATPYSPYGMGSISEKIVNKNLYDSVNYPLIFNRAINNTTGSIYATTSGNYYATEIYIPFNFGGKTITKTPTMSLAFYNANKEYISAIASNNTGVVPSNTKYIRFDIKKENKDIVQIELNSTATTYTAHQEQTYTIPVQQPMRSIGTVRDEFIQDENESLFERHYIVRKIIDGTMSISLYNKYTSYSVFYIVVGGNYRQGLSLSNYTENKGSTVYENNNIVGHFLQKRTDDYSYFYIKVPNTIASTVEELKTYLEELKNANVPMYADLVLQNPHDLPCTEEQVTAIESFLKTRTYKNVTNIYSEDEVPAYIDMTYVRDNETVINNLETRIETLESEG